MSDAADKMMAAAEKMAQAARDIDFSLTHHQRFLNDWLERLHSVLEEVLPEQGTVFDVNLVRHAEDEEDNHPTERPPPDTEVSR